MQRSTRRVLVGNVPIGGGAPVSIQSMTNTDTRDITATVQQIHALEKAGCDIVRISVYDMQCAEAIREIKQQTTIPLVADIHFDYRLALRCVENGIDKLRINPGNIGAIWKVRTLAASAKEHGVPIRIGVNAGSLEQTRATDLPEAMVESALKHVSILEGVGFEDIVISVKASSVADTVRANRLLRARVDYPLHIGVTEAGTSYMGTIKSAVGLGALLLDGVGDTIRVSLSGDPVREIAAAQDILAATGLRNNRVEMISCPTCGRCTIDVEGIALALQQRVAAIQVPIKAAVMGCVVNGPGEAKRAQVCGCGANGDVMIFVNGVQQQRVPADQAVEILAQEIEKLAGQ